MLRDKVILLTGGTGSFGKKFADIILKSYEVRKLIIFSRDELKQHEMRSQFNDSRLRFFIGDVRDVDAGAVPSGPWGHCGHLCSHSLWTVIAFPQDAHP